MNNEQLDKRFRELVQNNESDLTEAEQAAKEAVWQSLQPPKSNKIWRWKVAVGVLLLLLGLVFGVLQNKMTKQTARTQRAQQELLKTRDSLQQVISQLQQLERQSEGVAQEETPSVNASTTIIKYQDKYIDRIIEQRDTLLIEKQLLQAPDTIIIRDTAWIPTPTPTPTPAVIASTTTDSKQQQPSKVEFLFDAKSSDQKYKIPIYINGRAVVKKPTNSSQGIIKVKVN